MFGSGSGGSNPALMIVLMVGMIAVMYFVTIRPQKKRQKEEQTMRDNLQIGDEITTIGGIMGRVVTVKEDSIVIETGADRTKLRMVRSAVGTNNTQQEKLAEEREAAKKEQEAARDERLAAAGKKRKKSRKDGDEE
ncbi:MAG: preprotein translocase subunit YajC [Oscillospiraceae bacterium]|jgi:preprotein translocase subunit YajC|nr:preprotein translocase subunit YajC [Oscillospiraceae bacterium]